MFHKSGILNIEQYNLYENDLTHIKEGFMVEVIGNVEIN